MGGLSVTRTTGLIIALLSCLVLAAGCSTCKKPPEESMTAGHAVIGTSDAVYNLAWKLSGTFQSLYPAAFVDIVRSDDRSLVDSLLNERVEEILLDRPLARAESLAFHDAKLKLFTYPVAYYPVYLLVSKDNPVTRIDSAALRAVLMGTMNNWKRLGGGDVPITAYVPLPGDGAFQSLIAYFGGLDSVEAEVCSTSAAMLEKVKNVPGALLVYALPIEGLPYKRLSLLRQDYEIPGNVETIFTEPVYPFKLAITYVTTRNKIDVASGYLTFAVSNAGQREVMRIGYRPAAVPVRIVHMNK
jgi:ABC-type phosphate transport system substrate-binding protein